MCKYGLNEYLFLQWEFQQGYNIAKQSLDFQFKTLQLNDWQKQFQTDVTMKVPEVYKYIDV